MDKNDKSVNYYAIVAEYRGVAIIEKWGNKKAVWKGKEYFTDGYTYVAFKQGKEEGLFSGNNEVEAKALIDAFFDTPHVLPSNILNTKLLSYREVYEKLERRPYKGKVPLYTFDEKAGLFVEINSIRDGQHQHGNEDEA